jgi:hypothetical protein
MGVDGIRGVCSVPAEKRLELFILALMFLAEGVCTRQAMQSLLGSFVHPFSVRKLCMSVFGRAYRWTSRLRPKRLYRIPWRIAQEIFMAALLIPTAQSDLRAQVSTEIHFSDATPSTGGYVTGRVSQKLAGTLHDLCEIRGKHAKLDWKEADFLAKGWEDREIGREIEEALEEVLWSSSGPLAFRRTEHVNIQEVRSMRKVLRVRAEGSLEPERILCGVDSRVGLGCWVKGRSSSRWLNQVLQGSLGWSILGRKTLYPFWVATDKNYGDAPSRKKPGQPPRCPHDGYTPLARPQRSAGRSSTRGLCSPGVLGLEVFAGSGRLTRALRRAGLQMDCPIDTLQTGTYEPAHDLLNEAVFEWLLDRCRHKVYIYVHFGLPCSSWSALQRLNGGTRRLDLPEGSGDRISELEGNLLARRTVALCNAVREAGGFYSIENPKSSYVWHYPPVAELAARDFEVSFDQCEYGLGPPGGKDTAGQAGFRIKKATSIVTNLEVLKGLERCCSHEHQHFRCRGKVKLSTGWTDVAKMAGIYPDNLCKIWASWIASFLSERCSGRTPSL